MYLDNMKPSQRIEQIHYALKVLDGQNPEDKNFGGMTFFEKAICAYLDEWVGGTPIENRKSGK